MISRDEIVASGITPELIAHVEQQIPDLLKESGERLKHDPFYEGHSDSHYIATTDKREYNSLYIVAYLLHELGRKAVSTHEKACYKPEFKDKVFIRLDRIGEYPADYQILIRGELRPVQDMPLYVESGPHGAKSVFPLFDWSELQVKVGAMYIRELADARSIANGLKEPK